MPFKFLTYLQPTQYFRLFQTSGASVFPQVEALPELVLEQLLYDESYESEHARDYDLSWQAIQNGYIGPAATYTHFKPVSLRDNYLFIRKQFHPVWVFYVLICRLCTFHNPFKEIQAWVATAKTKRVAPVTGLPYDAWSHYKSQLLEQAPLVSVVIPTLNRYKYLKDVLEDLENQDYNNFEVLIVDQSEPFQQDFYTSFNLDLKVTCQKEKALWLARNTAIKEAKGEYLLFFDDDSRVNSDWVRQHLKCLDFFKADLSSGVSISQVGAKVPNNYGFFRISDQLDTGNVLIKKDVFRSIGLFDRQFEKQRMGDGEFGLRVYLQGYLNVSNPFAKRLHLKVNSGGLRELGSWDGFRPKKWFSPRPVPSVLYFYRKYYGNRSARLALLKIVPSSIMPYRYKSSPSLMLLGALLSVFITPFILFQVYSSWQLADKKINEGDKIERLQND